MADDKTISDGKPFGSSLTASVYNDQLHLSIDGFREFADIYLTKEQALELQKFVNTFLSGS